MLFRMRIILFGTIFRTRKSLEKILVMAAKNGRSGNEAFHTMVKIYNTGIFGICIYRTHDRMVDAEYFIDKANSERILTDNQTP